jgi:hypothetical protein
MCNRSVIMLPRVVRIGKGPYHSHQHVDGDRSKPIVHGIRSRSSLESTRRCRMCHGFMEEELDFVSYGIKNRMGRDAEQWSSK